MSKANQEKPKAGRPSKYRPEYAEQAMKLCLLRAMTDAELAEHFGVAESTVHLWKTAHPEFSESLKRGKTGADMEVVNALFRSAVGFTERVQKVVSTPKGTQIIEVDQFFEPSVIAGFFWLKNRHPDRWREKHEVTVTNTDAPTRAELDKLYEDAMKKAAERDATVIGRAERLKLIQGGKAEAKTVDQ